MSVDTDKTTIITFQGDSCPITFNGLEDLVGETIAFEVRDKKTNIPVFEELRSVVNNSGEVNYEITPEMSNNFNIKVTEKYGLFPYGIKQIDTETGEENTILLGDNPKFSDVYYMKVYLKKVEGNIEE